MLLPCPGFTSGLQTAEGWCCFAPIKKIPRGMGGVIRQNFPFPARQSTGNLGLALPGVSCARDFSPSYILLGFTF